MSITSQEIKKLIDLYFVDKFALYKLQYDSYSQFINEVVYKTLVENQNIIYVEDDKENNIIYEHYLKFDNIELRYPENDQGEVIYPEDARRNHLSYSSKLLVDVKQMLKIKDYNKQSEEEKIISEDKKILITKIPIMVRSKFCSTNIKSEYKNTECDYDPGCHFIIKGSEKVVLSLERMCENKMIIFVGKDDISYNMTVNSKEHDINANIQKIDLEIRNDGTINLITKQFGSVPVCIIFKALGLETDEKMVDHIIYDKNDIEMMNTFRKSILISSNETYNIDEETENEIKKVVNSEDALLYLSLRLRDSKKYNQTDIKIKMHQKMQYVLHILSNDFLPHMGVNQKDYKMVFQGKIYYLGLMVNRLLQCYLERIKPDDRDNYVNKRIELPGMLMAKLFRDYYKKMMLDVSKIFKKRFSGDNLNPISVINNIKSTVIEQGLNLALSIGTWGSPKKKGVAQVLQRLTYLFTVSYLRRIISFVNEANNKVDKMRHVNNISIGYIASEETPDGAQVGLVKNLSLTCNITMHISSQVQIVKNLLNNIKKDTKYELIELISCKRIQLRTGTRIFINGEWLGLTLKPLLLYEYLKQCRILGQIDKTVSIILDNFNNEIRLNCDGGRMYRPLLIVKNNKMILNKEMLNDIDLNNTNNLKKNKINNWNDFIYKYNNAVEYIDIEEAEMTMIAMYPIDIQKEYTKMNKIIEKPELNGNKVNRYDDTVFVEYTHCELHPMLMLGVVSSNIPFLNHNQSPRNYYSFAQTRQGISIYSTNYKNRNDLSYILYDPHLPLVRSVSTNYTNMVNMPYGVNCIVAIACYTGYNQEDSIIINKSALDRGLFRTVTFKKYTAELKKNSTTTQDDEFLKPDRKITANIKEGNYEKLNNEGYIPEETEIKNGDIIIGKVSPIQGDSDKKYIDQSEIFKSNVNGYVDKVFICFNSDEHKMYNMRVRSERYPMIGDKFASVHGQKGTIGLILDAADMPFTESGMQPDIIINPNCFIGSSLISMSNGLSRRIDSFSEQGLEGMLTFNNKNGLVNSYSLGMECKGLKETIKITLMDGRELICTPEHKIKVKYEILKDITNPQLGYKTEYLYKEAKDLITMDNKNPDTLVSSIEYPEDNINDDINCDWVLNMGEFNFNMKTYKEREKSLAFARILGYLLTDGTLHKVKDHKDQYATRLSIGLMVDVNQLLNDLYLLLGVKPQISGDEYVYVVSIPNKLGKEIANLEGMINGRRTTQESSLPTFLFKENCPKSFIREFLGGYFGGDGHSPYIQYNTFITVKLSQSTCQEFEESLVQKMNNIILLLNKVGVDSKIQRIRDCHKNTKAYQDRPRIQVEISVNSNIEFLNKIGFRYCTQKIIRLCVAVSYERYGILVKKQHNKMMEIINEKISNQSKVNINLAIEESRNEYYKFNKPLNEYYSLLDKNQVSNRRKKDRSNTLEHFDYKYFPRPEEYLKMIGCENCFGKDNEGNKKYLNNKNDNYIPTWNMKILQIEKHTEELVYDIGIAKYNNFVVEGNVVSNCVPSRMTVAQLIECIVGKASGVQGIPIDGTPFNNYDINDASKILEKNGFKGTGEETMYCGLTGKKMNSKIFIGPTYYMRLKHMVQEKIHARAKGPQQLLTRQAPDGRAKEGGLRFGEMERDSIISHGLAYFLKEKLLDSSDKYEVWVCNECGKFAQKMIDKDIYVCKECKNTETSKVTIPYAFKLLIQELMSINILTCIKPELIN